MVLVRVGKIYGSLSEGNCLVCVFMILFRVVLNMDGWKIEDWGRKVLGN